LQLLSIQGSSELGCFDTALSEWIVIEEEFSESDSVSLDKLSDFSHNGFDFAVSREVGVFVSIGRLNTGVWLVDGVVEDTAIVEESKVLNVSLFVSVELDD